MNTRLTKREKFLHILMFVLSILFYGLMFAVFIGTILWLDNMEKRLGVEFVEATYAHPAGIFAIVGMIVLGLLGWKCYSLTYEI